MVLNTSILKTEKDITVYADNPKEDLFPLNPLDNEIVSCLDVIIGKYNTLHESVLSQKLFSIESDFVERNPTLVREYNEGDYFDPELEISPMIKLARVEEHVGMWLVKTLLQPDLNI